MYRSMTFASPSNQRSGRNALGSRPKTFSSRWTTQALMATRVWDGLSTNYSAFGLNQYLPLPGNTVHKSLFLLVGHSEGDQGQRKDSVAWLLCRPREGMAFCCCRQKRLWGTIHAEHPCRRFPFAESHRLTDSSADSRIHFAVRRPLCRTLSRRGRQLSPAKFHGKWDANLPANKATTASISIHWTVISFGLSRCRSMNFSIMSLRPPLAFIRSATLSCATEIILNCFSLASLTPGNIFCHNGI